MYLIPKNWNEFQHYKDRCPPWIKLHRDLLNDRDFMRLPLASKAIAPLLWLLASEDKSGKFNADIEELEFRLRMSESDIKKGLNALIDNGFFIDADTMLAPCLQDATPEAEAEAETDRFAEFWDAFADKRGRQGAERVWKRKKLNQRANDVIEGAKRYALTRGDNKQYWKQAQGWLNDGRWEDDYDVAPKIAGDDYTSWRKIGAENNIHPLSNESDREYIARVKGVVS